MTLADCTPTLQALFEKIDSNLVNARQARFLIHSILSLRDTTDGLTQAIKNLNQLINKHPWARQFIPEGNLNSISALAGLEIQLKRDGEKFLKETVSRWDRNNPLTGRIPEYPIVSCWTQRNQLSLGRQKQWVEFLLVCLFVWRNQFPFPEDQHIDSALNSQLEILCGKLRSFLAGSKTNVAWPELATAPIDSLSLFLEFVSPIDHPLAAMAGGVQQLLNAFTGVKKRLSRPPLAQSTGNVTSPIPPKHYTKDGSGEDVAIGGIDTILPTPITHIRYLPPVDGSIDDEPDVANIIELPADLGLGGDDLISTEGRFSRLRSARYRNALDNQFLPWAWPKLNRYEVTRFVDALEKTSDQDAIPATLCLLSLLCSLNYQELCELKVVDQFDLLTETTQISVTTAGWSRYFPAIDGRFTPNEEQAQLLAESNDLLALALPDLAVRLLQSAIGDRTGTLGRLLKLSADQIEETMREYCSRLRTENRKLRILPGRLRSVIFNHLMQHSGDELYSAVAVNSDEQAPSVGLYYYSAPKDKLGHEYLRVLGKLGLACSSRQIESCSRFGSKLYWPPESHAAHLQNWLRQLTERQNNAPQSYQELAEFHNCFVAYTAWMLICGTGHRPAEKLSFSQSTLTQTEAIISDKQVDEAHMARLVLLSPLLQAHIQHYQTHLHGLAQRLKKISPTLASQIGGVITLPALNSAQPFLFFLNSDTAQPVSSIGTKLVWEKLELPTELPRNLSRHWFVTGLREMGILGEWVSAAAGHIQIGQQPWSVTSLSTPTEIQQVWNDGVDRWLNKLGFQLVQGLSIVSKSKLPCSFGAPTVTEQIPFSAREFRFKLKSSMHAWITEALAGKPREELFMNLDIQGYVRRQIQREFSRYPSRQVIAINLFVRYLALHGRSISNSRALGLALDSAVEPSPFSLDHLYWVERGEWLRQNLLPKIPRDFVLLTSTQQAAWLMLALACYTGLIDPRQQSLCYQNLPTSRHYLGEHFWLEWFDDARCIRYWPDFYSSLLLTRLNVGNLPAWGKVQSEMDKIIHLEVQFEIGLPRSSGQQKHRHLSFAMNALRAWQLAKLPGLLAHYAQGRLKPWAISKNNLARLLTGRRVANATAEPCIVEPRIRLSRAQIPSFIASRRALNALKEVISKTLSASQKRTDDGRARESRKSAIRDVNLLMVTWNDQQLSSLLPIFAEYSKYQLLRRSNGKYREGSTVLDYIGSVAVPLLEQAWDQDWLELSTEELEVYYCAALELDSTITRERRAKRLRYFHDFCVDYLGQDPVDLCAIDPAFLGASQRVQPQIISLQEYEIALEFLYLDTTASQEQRHLQALFLIFIFKYGLRVGEALRISIDDLVEIDDVHVLYVHRNKFGAPKSRAGTRQLPCWRLSDLEKQLIRDRVQALQHRFGDISAPLFCEHDNPHQLNNRSIMTGRVLAALKLATGDQSVRIHDARHTFASASIASGIPQTPRVSTFAEWFGNSPQQLRQMWLGTSHPSRRLLHAISLHLGHAHFETTVNKYTHSCDLMLDACMKDLPIPTVTGEVIAQLMGISADLVRQLKSRATSLGRWRTALLARACESALLQPFMPDFLYTPTIDEFITLGRVEYEPIKLRQIERIIIDTEQGVSFEDIARHFSIEKSVVEKIDLIAKKLSSELGFDLKSFTPRNPEKYILPQQYIDLMNRFEKINEHPLPALTVWHQNYNPKIPGLQIANIDEQELFIEFIKRLEARSINMAINKKHAFDYHKLSSGNIAIRHARYKSTFMMRHKKTIAPQFIIQFHGKEGDFSSRLFGMVQFHKLMFLMRVRCEVLTTKTQH